MSPKGYLYSFNVTSLTTLDYFCQMWLKGSLILLSALSILSKYSISVPSYIWKSLANNHFEVWWIASWRWHNRGLIPFTCYLCRTNRGHSDSRKGYTGWSFERTWCVVHLHLTVGALGVPRSRENMFSSPSRAQWHERYPCK